MIDNHFQRTYFLVITFLASVVILLIALLFFEYFFFCKQAQELIELKQQYYGYIDDIQKKIDGNNIKISIATDDLIGVETDSIDPVMTPEELSIAQDSDDPDDDDDYIEEPFVVINRQPEYLRQSTMDYVQEQEPDLLLTSMDIDQWAHYTDQKIVPVQEKKTAIVSQTVCSQRQAHISALKKPIKNFGLVWPIDKDKFWLSSLFGARKKIDGTWGFHHGIDMAAVKGTRVKAACGGKVIEACFQSGYGNTVVIQHTAQIKTRYAHLHTIHVGVGQIIKAGVIVGTVGETGFIRKKGKDGSHLHFEVYEKGKRVNPLHCLPRSG